MPICRWLPCGLTGRCGRSSASAAPVTVRNSVPEVGKRPRSRRFPREPEAEGKRTRRGDEEHDPRENYPALPGALQALAVAPALRVAGAGRGCTDLRCATPRTPGESSRRDDFSGGG